MSLSHYFFAIFLLSLSLSALSENNADKKAALTEKELSQVSQKITRLQKELLKEKGSLKKEQNALRDLELELSQLRKKLLSLNATKKSIQEKTTILKQQEKTLQKNKSLQQKNLQQDLRAIYKIGKQEKIKLLLNQENPEDLARTLKYYDYYTEARVKRILNFQENLKQLTLKQAEINVELENLNKVQLKLTAQSKTKGKKQAEREKVLAGINQNIKSKGQELGTLKANRIRLGKLLRSLKGIWADIPNTLNATPFKKLKGKFNRPVQGSIEHAFGSQRLGGRLEWHGWLINAPMEKPIKVIHGGRIVFSDWIRGYGMLIIVDHGDEYLSLYGHNASLLKETGEWVSEGEPIATVGDSGGQYDSGLYFEIRHKSKPLDPKLWIK